MTFNFITLAVCVLSVSIPCQYYVHTFLSVSAIVVDKRKFTGYGTYIANMTANSKLTKYAKVDVKMKQRVLAHFFKLEGVNKTEINRRLNLQFGDETIHLSEQETSEELEKRRSLHYNVVERIIIQFLSAEKVRPAEIFKRLRRVSDHGQHWCNVYRWVYKFRKGRTEVANIPCKPTTKPKTKATTAGDKNITLSKCAKISESVKYKILLQFLKNENVSESVRNERILRQFGNKTFIMEDAESVNNIALRSIHPSVQERIIIQFLTNEGARPQEIIKRLNSLNMLQNRHRCFVYRWVSKFKEGRADVENKHWMKMRKQQKELLNDK